MRRLCWNFVLIFTFTTVVRSSVPTVATATTAAASRAAPGHAHPRVLGGTRPFDSAPSPPQRDDLRRLPAELTDPGSPWWMPTASATLLDQLFANRGAAPMKGGAGRLSTGTSGAAAKVRSGRSGRIGRHRRVRREGPATHGHGRRRSGTGQPGNPAAAAAAHSPQAHGRGGLRWRRRGTGGVKPGGVWKGGGKGLGGEGVSRAPPRTRSQQTFPLPEPLLALPEFVSEDVAAIVLPSRT